MKIAFFADSYKPYLSGVTNTVEILIKELRALGHKVYLFAPGYPGHQETDPDIFRFPSLPSRYPHFRLAIPLVKHFPEVDLVHSHTPFQTGLVARYLAWRNKVPFVYSFHTLFTRYTHFARFIPEPIAKDGLVSYLRFFCNSADSIITPSQLSKRVLLAWDVETPINIIPSGVELSLVKNNRDALRKKLGLNPTDKVLLYIGRLSEEKNLPFLLQAFGRLSSTLAASPPFLVLVGGGPMEKQLREQHLKNVIVVGEVAYPEVLGYYSLGDIFLFSSFSETQGLVLAEAKAAGLPIVALFAGGLTASVRPGVDGFLTKRSLPAFLEKISLLLADDPLRQKMSVAAREDVVSRFSSVVIAKQTESLYNFLIEKSH